MRTGGRYIYPALPEIEESNPEFTLFEWIVYGFGQIGMYMNS